jgi:hypothetical protein
MVKIELCRPAWTEEGIEVVAVIVANDRDVSVDGDMAEMIDLSMPVMSVNEHRPIHLHENAEEWTRSLPGAYRAPDLFARVVADDHPVEEEQADPIVIRDAVAH